MDLLQSKPLISVPAGVPALLGEAETLYRMGIVSEVLSQTIFLFMALTCYKLLKDVQRDWARAMVVLVGVGAAVGFVNCLNLVLPLILLKGGPTFAGFTPAQVEQLAYATLRLHGFGATIVTWFLGLWLVPFGMLVARSGFFPRILGYLVAFAGLAHAAYAIVVLVAPAAAPTFFKYVTQPSGGFGEMPMLLWLLIKGAGSRQTTAPPPEATATS